MTNTSSTPKHSCKVVCHECENSVYIPQLQNRQKASCPRCGLVLTRHNHQALPRIIAYSLSALIFLGFALPFKFLGFSANGQQQSIGIISGLDVLVEQDYVFLAIIQMLSIIVLPTIVLSGLLMVLLPLQFGRRLGNSKSILTVIFALIPWSMAEIFLIGVLVSLIKISSLADISVGLSFYAYIGFTLCMSMTFFYLDKHQLFLTVADCAEHARPVRPTISIQRTWALLLTSIFLYIPANLLPIMNTRFLGNDEPSTILGGVVLLWQSGSYPIAAIIFIASVIVPVGKLVILTWLNFTVQRGFAGGHNERIFWYRVTEFIGRWSMIDVFVVAILVSLIQLGNTMSVFPGPAATAFCGVVILTMLAAITFDTRLIWRNSVGSV